ncbi:MAG TPA: glutathione S-transferase family protein [Caulobacteraceae bacterium]|jgi:glutathione S-transferase|nr:glutathione S-transferase family protein [Caulobacteraceae bacterium]
MSLTLHYHPLSSYSWKALIPLYENGTPFERVIVNYGEPVSRDAHFALWPMGKIPVLHDAARGETVPEASVIIDYLDRRYPGPLRFTPADPDQAWRTRLWDRFFDLHVQSHVQKIVGDRIRPAGQQDPYGVADARAQLAAALACLEGEAAKRAWFSGDAFGLADCAAAPAIYYADRVQPLTAAHAATRGYLDRLMARPSFDRTLKEAEPYFAMFPAG